MHICGHVHGRLRVDVDNLPQLLFHFILLRQGLFPSITSQLALEVEEITGGVSHPPDIWVGSGDVSSGPLVCTANALTTEPCSQLYFADFCPSAGFLLLHLNFAVWLLPTASSNLALCQSHMTTTSTKGLLSSWTFQCSGTLPKPFSDMWCRSFSAFLWFWVCLHHYSHPLCIHHLDLLSFL